MEYVFRGLIVCPKDDEILTDWRQASISDETELKGMTWAELKPMFINMDYFTKKEYIDSLTEDE